MSLRKVTSLTTLLAFILLITTSIILYITPQGKIAFWANWSYWGIGKEEWGALHTNLGFLFIIAGLIHTVLNWKPIMAYLKNKAKQFKMFTVDFNIALGITLVITGMTLFRLPPINAIQTFNTSLKDAAAQTYGEPPYGHAEASTLKLFCKRTGLDLKDSIKKLEKKQLTSVAADATLAEMAKANDMTPQQVYDFIKPALAEGKEKGMPEKPGFGFGRKALTRICAEYGLDLQNTIDGLETLGIEATGEASMKDIAEKNKMEPHTVFEAIRQLQTL
jgi:predicted DNA-binding protein YlxM (UPF0122 family)